MEFRVIFRQMEATDALKSYAKDRMEKIKKYFPDPISCDVTLSTEKRSHRADVNLKLHNGFHVSGHESTENMYSSLDIVSAKIERQVRKYKDRLRNHKKERTMNALPVVHSIIEEASKQSSADKKESAPKPSITKTEMVAEAMTVEEAIMQLNLAHKDFLVFRNEEGGHVSVLYRREAENSYGLIDTSKQ